MTHEVGGTRSFHELAERWDLSDMARVIAGMGGQIDFALEDAQFPDIVRSGIEEILVVGMGGSVLPVDIINDTLADWLPRSLQVSRHYHLPRAETQRRLLVFSSFSGNTQEVIEPLLSMPAEARNIAVITAGGQLASIGEERGYPTIIIPAAREPNGFQPRCASGYIVTYLARLLTASGFATVPFKQFQVLSSFLGGLDLRAEGEALALALEGRIPIFYSDERHALSLARIAKIKYNENAKRPAFFNALPEASHNEMIGLSGADEQLVVVYFRDPESHPRVHQCFDIMRRVLAGPHVSFLEWEMLGANRLERVFATLMLADWVSYFSALLRGVDPTPVALVEEFKRLLTQSDDVGIGE